MIHCYISEKLPSACNNTRGKLREIALNFHSKPNDAHVLIERAACILKETIESKVHYIAQEDATRDDIPQTILEYLCKQDLTKLNPALKEYLEKNYSKAIQQFEADIQQQLILKVMIADQVAKEVASVCDPLVKEHERQRNDLLKKIEDLTENLHDYERRDREQKQTIQGLQKDLELEKEENENRLHEYERRDREQKQTIQGLQEDLELEKERNNTVSVPDGDLWFYLICVSGGAMVGAVIGVAFGAWLGAQIGVVAGAAIGAGNGGALGSIPYFMKQKGPPPTKEAAQPKEKQQ